MTKKSILLFLVISVFQITFIRADEGMWLPHLLKVLNEKDMKAMGFKLSADDIYSVNKKSMKDAVVLFGRGCTGELVSGEGLMFTNHHCGFGQIQDHSSVEHDYLTNGFWAMNRSQELPNPGLSVTFIIEIKDVTNEIIANLKPEMTELERENAVTAASIPLISKAVEGTHYEAIIKPMYGGNEYLLFITETFKDVRLVGAPPMHIGNFGKDSDNWTWPRHTGDFAVFRIYAGKDNKPADYSPENVPFKPRHFFPVSLKGVKENDFTMVYGFPARTNEYLHSAAVDLTINQSNPIKVELRDIRLKTMKEAMDTNKTVFIKYADKYSSVANYWKKWSGESRGLTRANAIDRKREFEARFQKEVDANAGLAEYKNLLKDLEILYSKMKPVMFELDLFSEGILSSEILKYANTFTSYFEALNANNYEKATTLQAELKKKKDGFYKDFDKNLEIKLLAASFFKVYQIKPDLFINDQVKQVISEKDLKKWEQWSSQLVESSVFQSEARLTQFLDQPLTAQQSKLQNDPLFQLIREYEQYYRNSVYKEFIGLNGKIISLNRKYILAQRKVIKNKKFYPDANQTLRVTFGKAEGYKPYDGVNYLYHTTAEGIIEKYKAGARDHVIDQRLKDLIESKNFGRYADKKSGKLHTCFAASNHTSGGNSGSPVINADGHLIGTNFDRNWEGTMSDIFYDINQVRNITLDVRYTLWIIDIYAGAGHLIKEMSIVE